MIGIDLFIAVTPGRMRASATTLNWFRPVRRQDPSPHRCGQAVFCNPSARKPAKSAACLTFPHLLNTRRAVAADNAVDWRSGWSTLKAQYGTKR